jgi:hypothetical protein
LKFFGPSLVRSFDESERENAESFLRVKSPCFIGPRADQRCSTISHVLTEHLSMQAKIHEQAMDQTFPPQISEPVTHIADWNECDREAAGR